MPLTIGLQSGATSHVMPGLSKSNWREDRAVARAMARVKGVTVAGDNGFYLVTWMENGYPDTRHCHTWREVRYVVSLIGK